jgi:YcxB-like protein
MIEVGYRSELRHWKAYNYAANSRASSGGFILQLIGAAAVGFLFLFLLIAGAQVLGTLLKRRMDDFSFSMGMYTSLVFLGLLLIGSTMRKLRRFVRPDGHVLGQRHVRLTDAAVETWGQHDQARYSWSAFEGVSASPKLVALWLEPAVAIFIPREAFATSADVEAFVAFAQARIGGAT